MQTSNAVVAANTVAPGVRPSKSAPGPRKPPPTISGVCNSYLPADTVINRLLYVVNYLTTNGFYVILDNQFNFDDTIVRNPDQWVQQVSSPPRCCRDCMPGLVIEQCTSNMCCAPAGCDLLKLCQ